MLKKLYRHEFYSLYRSLLPIYIGLILFAGLTRLTGLIDGDFFLIGLLKGMSNVLSVVGIIALSVVALVVILVRFYKNLLSSEGYLTFTLPFTATQHIVCKLICAFVAFVSSLAVSLGAVLILGIGTEVEKSIFTVLKGSLLSFKEMLGTGKLITLGAVFVLFVIFGLITSLLTFYVSMAVGQRFKNKIGGAILVYILLYIAIEFIETLLVIPAMVFSDKMTAWAESNLFTAILLGSILGLIVYIVLSTVYFLITRHMLTNKLNLE